jgi:beta-glucosidase
MQNLAHHKNLNALVLTGCLVLITGVAFPVWGAPRETNPPLAGLEQRIDALLGQMTTQEKIEQLFYKTDGNKRLGIPQFTGSDGPHGIGNKAKGWSSFPVTLAMAATWDTEVIQRVGKAIALEQASRGRHRIAGPTLDLLSDPRNGRAPETIGEDPFLGGKISAAFLRGMNETAVFGTIKHYNLNTYEAGRETNNYLIDERSLVEFWGEHWRQAVQDGGALSVMCAYNRVNGEKSAENKVLIKDILRDQWGFSGYTMSDWGGFDHTEKAMASELDFCEGNERYIKELPGLLASNRVSSAQLDHAVADVLRVKILSGMLDGQPVVSPGVRDSAAHRELVHESGLKSLVLLKNQAGILPLRPEIKSVAVIGPNAANLPLDGNSSSAVIPTYTITLQQGLTSLLSSNRVTYARGCDINSSNRSGFAAALDLARKAEVVVFAGGLDNTVEGEEYFIKGDRLTGSVDLPGEQNALINELAKVNPNVVLVVISGGPCAVHKVIGQVKGLLYAFYPGQEGGRAIAEILLGRENPGGKLPVTIPKGDDQLRPRSLDFRGVCTNGFGYRWFDRQRLEPEFAFGFGLSYTEFKYRNLQITPGSTTASQPVTVTAEVENIGSRAGEEVAQLYLAAAEALKPPVTMPVKQLKGFARIKLAPGEKQLVKFSLTPDTLYVFDSEQRRYFVPAGDYRVMVGGSSDSTPLTGRFSLTPARELPDLLVANLRTVPPFPKAGDKVIFVANVMNRGTGPTPAGLPITVAFRVSGQSMASATTGTNPVFPGGMAMVSSPLVTVDLPGWREGKGKFQIQAGVDPLGSIEETSRLNNSCESTLLLPGGKATAVKPALESDPNEN